MYFHTITSVYLIVSSIRYFEDIIIVSTYNIRALVNGHLKNIRTTNANYLYLGRGWHLYI